MRGRSLIVLCSGLAGCLVGTSGQSNITVDGLGWWENRQMESRVAFLHGFAPNEPAELDTAVLEDTAFLLYQQVRRQGYLQPRLSVDLIRGDGSVERVEWEAQDFWLPSGTTAEAASYQVEPGCLYYFESVQVDGLAEVSLEHPERYFVPGGALFNTRRARAYTPANLERRTQRLIDSLRQLGYRSARSAPPELEMDDTSGAVQVYLKCSPGPVFRVGMVELIDNGESRRLPELAGAILTPQWELDLKSKWRRIANEEGYPDARVWLESAGERAGEAGLVQDLKVQLKRGPAVSLRSVRFDGDEATKRSILKRQVDLTAGAPLDVQEVSEGRRRAMALGIFREVDYSIEPESASERDVTYHLVPGRRKELQLQAGWGSYEQLRAGFRGVGRNPFGRANVYEFGMKQSFKSQSADAIFSVPQLYGSAATAYVQGEYEEREEISYTTSHYGGSVGALTTLGERGLRLSAEYSLFKEDVDREEQSDFRSEENATVASLTFKATLDRRNDFLAPTAGYNLYLSYELANSLLGGSVDFHKFEVGGGIHQALTDSTILHFGLSGGYLYAPGAADENIPFGRRFFTGGENSVRGYREGEASPLDTDGNLIGAEAYALSNLELEQRLFEAVSVVFFWDSVVNARERDFGEGAWLNSVGLGIRYQTLVGPLRVEYGHNLNPRSKDTDGTLHFSIGFPF
ncbi:BamA/OMP85 family outer membrane protein [Coraliomargarita parva]|uniref:BamA/OMP85 family outer membrane protein n=1 Tax=Coraliomargarita parva TaxID=3014050 RepID=UPI0022B5BE94|nr:BamA/TamA family outer membrane protein [Coraliomargarita parva]